MTRKRKFNAHKIALDGLQFDSAAEARVWQELLIMERAGLITDLERQCPYVLAPSVKLHGEARAKPPVRYFVDFRYKEVSSGKWHLIDVKGMDTPVSRLKRHLMKTVHGLDVRLVK